MAIPRLLAIAAVAVASARGTNAQSTRPTAAQITARIVERAGIASPSPTVDTFKAGDPNTPVRGIAVTMMATLDVLKRAAAGGNNLIITHEPTFYGHRDDTDAMQKENDPVLAAKTQGKVVSVLPAGAGAEGTHHTEHSLQPDGLLFADDFGLGRTSIFDLNDGANPKLHASFTTAGPFGWPHSYARLPSGNRLVTYQWQAAKFNSPPGGLAEVRTDGTVVRWASAKTGGTSSRTAARIETAISTF